MDKKNPTLLSMVLVLLGIALVCSAGVAAVYNATKPVIDNARQTKKVKTVSKVLPQFDNSPIDEAFTIVSADNDSLLCYPAKSNGETVGYAVSSFSNKGYGGKIEVLVGFPTALSSTPRWYRSTKLRDLATRAKKANRIGQSSSTAKTPNRINSLLQKTAAT